MPEIESSGMERVPTLTAGTAPAKVTEEASPLPVVPSLSV